MHDPAKVTTLIHENMSVVVMFAFGEPPARDAMNRFKGEWKYLSKMIYQVSEARADRALLEMGTQLRILDDREDITSSVKTVFGKVVNRGWQRGATLFPRSHKQDNARCGVSVGFRRQSQS